MLRFIARRLLETVPVLLIIVTATFFMIRFVPGGPFTSEKAVAPEVLRNLQRAYHLDEPLWQQYTTYLGQVLHGDLGPSFKYPNRTVNEIIADKLPVSLELGGLALFIALTLGLPLGVLAAARRNSWLDYLASTVALGGVCVPTFVLGPVLVLLLAINLHWFNASGWYGPADRVLPALISGGFSLLLPFFVAVLVPALSGERLSDSSDFRIALELYRAQPITTALEPEAAIQAWLFQQFLVLLAFTPITAAMSVAAYAIIGEKQARTLEPLLATPIRSEEHTSELQSH